MLRKDAVVMCVTIFKPPVALMQTLEENEQQRLLEDGAAKIRQIVGEGNVKAEAWHFDEQGGHVHIFWEPMTVDGRLCAKERHNLQFLSQLNREIPEHLRSKGWDIENCNAYDAAMDEMEKTQRRQRNGRSSAVYKADAERQLNYINAKIQQTYDTVEHNARNFGEYARENVAFETPNVYDNIIYLMSECDDSRFEELDREGQELKRKHLGAALVQEDIPNHLEQIIENVATLSWEERQRFWEDYRIQSGSFWELRAFLKKEYIRERNGLRGKLHDVLWEYYRTLYCLESSRSIFLMLVYSLKALLLIGRTVQIETQIETLRKERDALIQNTASFKKFSKSYAEELKAGILPTDRYLNAMERIVADLDQKAMEIDRRDASRYKKKGHIVEK